MNTPVDFESNFICFVFIHEIVKILKHYLFYWYHFEIDNLRNYIILVYVHRIILGFLYFDI